MEEELSTLKNVVVNDADEDDPPVLSSHALAALKEFLEEQSQSIAKLETEETGGRGTEPDNEVTLVTEDWRLSQFWYDPETAPAISQEVVTLCSDSNYKVARIACPTLYAYIKKIDPNISLRLLEYDKRFEQYGSDFTFYDYNQSEDLPLELKHTYQVVTADPPYLYNTYDVYGCRARSVLEKVAQTVSFLAHPHQPYLLLLTGEVQRDRAAELLGLRPCNFRPRHSSKLGNEFWLFTNYDPRERLGGWEQEN